MAYNTALAERVRIALASYDVLEKNMFGSCGFMVNGKLCVSVGADRLLCRLSLEDYEEALTSDGVRPMNHGGRVMKGYVFVSDSLLQDDEALMRWITKALTYNAILTNKR